MDEGEKMEGESEIEKKSDHDPRSNVLSLSLSRSFFLRGDDDDDSMVTGYLFFSFSFENPPSS